MLRDFQETTGQKSASRQNNRRTPLGWVRFIVLLVLLALIIRSLIIAPFNIPSRSMTPNLLIGDYLFVAKWPYGYSQYSFPFSPDLFEGRIGAGRPDRGDIIVFLSPADPNSAYIKRVIGLPGDTVQMVGGELRLNGEIVSRDALSDFRETVADAEACATGPGSNIRIQRGGNGEIVCLTPQYRETLPGGRSYTVLDAGNTTADMTQEFRVPDGHYFLMGDDRDRSADSRYPAEPEGGIGLVPEEYIIGRALFIFWSTDGSASWINPISWFTAARGDRIGQSLH